MKSTKPAPAPAPQHQHDAAAAFLREVDEALQYERLLTIWHTYKFAILAAILVVLLAVAGLQGLSAYKAHQARGLAERWHAFTQISAESTRKAQLESFLKSSNGGYHALAAFKQADLATTPQAKAAAYKLVAEDSSQPLWLRNLARLSLAISLLTVDDATAQSQLELLTQEGQQNTATYAPALEQLAILAQRKNDSTAARGYTEKLLAIPSEQLPPDLHQRARQRMGLLSTLPR